jgi:hypothetical protein
MEPFQKEIFDFLGYSPAVGLRILRVVRPKSDLSPKKPKFFIFLNSSFWSFFSANNFIPGIGDGSCKFWSYSRQNQRVFP